MKTLFGIGMLALLILTGCATGDVGMVCPISGGETVTFVLTSKGPKPAENDDFLVVGAAIIPNVEHKQFVYSFGLWSKKEKAPKHVTVEDVSEEKIELLVDDAAPKLEAKYVWKQDSAPKTATDPRLGWLYHEGNSPRVYRFTITTDDGRQLVMYQLTFYPVFIKEPLRKILGMAPLGHSGPPQAASQPAD
ncbi:MAG TPA: hypothetical protein VMC06_15480 [Opitutaceae bacterium]|nr:hypothetical protein [Opitutaceae bacterium]